MFHKYAGHVAVAHHVARHTGGSVAVAHHVARHVGNVSMWGTFKYRFLHSLVYTEVYRFFRRIGLFYSGQNALLHALITALAGCLAYFVFHKIYKLFSKK